MSATPDMPSDTAANVPAWEHDRLRALQDCQEYLIARAGTEAVRYSEAFNRVLDPLRELFAKSADLTKLSELKADAALIDLARFLVSTAPMSQDDLKIIVEGVDRPARQQKKLTFLVAHLDPVRFSWLNASRLATDVEREAALRWTAGIWASNKSATNRRMELGRLNEKAVRETVEAAGYTRGEMPLAPGEFCGETTIGGSKADLVVRLWDGRLLLIECKSSLSAVNSHKRVGLEVMAKPAKWAKGLPRERIVPAACLSGVFDPNTIERMVGANIRLFWQHDLEPLTVLLSEKR